MKFLGRAKKYLRDLATEPDTKVQYFNVTCASGHRVRGERTEGYQALRCPACGEGVFVLPRSPFPEPVAPPQASGTRTPRFEVGPVEEGPVELSDPVHAAVELVDRVPKGAEADIIWEDTLAETAAAAGPASADLRTKSEVADGEDDGHVGSVPEDGARRTSAPTSDPARARRGRSADEGLAERPRRPRPAGQQVPEDRRGRPASPRRSAVAGRADPRRSSEPSPQPVLASRVDTRRRGLQRLIFLAVPVIVIATVGWRYVKQRRQEYPLIAERGRTEGIPALDEGDFDKAYQLLSAAKSAVEALRGAVEDADSIRHAAEEAEIFVNRSDRGLEEMLAEAGRTDPESWASKFDTFYKGRTVIIESWITAVPGQGNASAYEVEYRVFPQGEASNFRDAQSARPDRFAEIDLKGLELFELPQPNLGDHVTFGAKLSAFEYDRDRNGWVVRFEPKSGVFIQHNKALEAAGWPVAKEIDLPLENQP